MSHWLDKVVELLSAETSDLRELALLADGDPERFYIGVDPAKLDINPQETEGINFIGKIAARVNEIRKTGTKEERLSMLLDEVLQDRDIGRQILEKYARDKSVYATRAIDELRLALEHETENSKFNNVQLLKIMRKPLHDQIGENKPILFFYMAKYFSKYPDIKTYLRNLRMRQSHSGIYERKYGKQINEYLE